MLVSLNYIRRKVLDIKIKLYSTSSQLTVAMISMWFAEVFLRYAIGLKSYITIWKMGDLDNKWREPLTWLFCMFIIIISMLSRLVRIYITAKSGEGATALKCIPGVKLPKYTYTLIHLKIFFLIFLQNFEQDNYFTSTTLLCTLKMHNIW